MSPGLIFCEVEAVLPESIFSTKPSSQEGRQGHPRAHSNLCVHKQPNVKLSLRTAKALEDHTRRPFEQID